MPFIPSIRRRLLLVLMPVLLLGWTGMAAWTWYDTAHEIEEVYDATLAQTARLLLAQVRYLLHEKSEQEADRHDMEISAEGPGHKYESKIAFSVRTTAGARLLHTPGAPDFATAAADGYRDEVLDDAPWRVFSLQDRERGILVQTGQKYEVRHELVLYITLNTLGPMLLALPLLALLTWFSVGRSLRPLNQLAAAVARRRPDALEPVAESRVPSEARPLVAAINQLIKRMAQAFDRERRFTADAAHELRTPLAALKTQAQVALRAGDDTVRANALRQINHGVDRSTRLLEQLLTLARMDAHHATTGAESVDLGRLVAECVAEAAPEALARDVEVGLDAPAGDYVIHGSAGALGVLLRNLLDNALRYTPAGGEVSVGLQEQARGVTLCVTDTGPGIPPEEREAVFERFRRGADAAAPGSGLGLSIVKRIAELHGSRVRLEAGPGGAGLRVCVTLPRDR
ncbi:ATP-binding protein [Thioalbus denitrificans]|uniref:histidine kinase n=1 Tax=Thioalbus denitrificans TaxID=547122 RepID=A0A369C103_9GAMM|nr:ATP-binding protein [Thioalbus denitrificans]RCX26347.1 two-component system sensor histidine kinase QseC [Thioalbus denitrificans]